MDISFICRAFHPINCLYCFGGHGYSKLRTYINCIVHNPVDFDNSDLDSMAGAAGGFRHKQIWIRPSYYS